MSAKKPLPGCFFFFTSSKKKPNRFEEREQKNTIFERRRIVARVCDGMLLIPFPLHLVLRFVVSVRLFGSAKWSKRGKKNSRFITNCRPKVILQKTQVKHTSSLPNLSFFTSAKRPTECHLMKDCAWVRFLVFCHEPISDAGYWVLLVFFFISREIKQSIRSCAIKFRD